jgi:hypothetical protein
MKMQPAVTQLRTSPVHLPIMEWSVRPSQHIAEDTRFAFVSAGGGPKAAPVVCTSALPPYRDDLIQRWFLTWLSALECWTSVGHGAR